MAENIISEDGFQRIFEALPQQYIIVDPQLTIVAATDAFLSATLKQRENAIGRNILEVFPDNPDDPTADGTKVLEGSLREVLESGETLTLPPQRYDMELADGSFEVHYWQPMNVPVFGADGEVAYVAHGAEDITARLTASSD